MEYIFIIIIIGYLIYRYEKLEKEVDGCRDTQQIMANQYRSLESDLWDLEDRLEKEQEKTHKEIVSSYKEIMQKEDIPQKTKDIATKIYEAHLRLRGEN